MDHPINLQQGMTLVEVMVAAVILALVMMSVMAVASHSSRSTARLQQKTQAAWVANTVAAESRAEVYGKITPTGSFQGTQTLGGKQWFWQAKASNSSQEEVILLNISVQENENSPEVLTTQTAVWSPKK